MFEFSVACKYLIPRWRQLSVSIISLLSIFVIALVVWLIVVFFSITNGLEKNWTQKLTALTAPLRITPTDAYYNSYYYQIDSISENTGYSYRTIGEKQASLDSDPYDPEIDQEIPSHWPSPDRNANGKLKNLVQLAFSSLQELGDTSLLQAGDFELTATHLHLNLQRHTTIFQPPHLYGEVTQSFLSYPVFLGNFEKNNHELEKALLSITTRDLTNILDSLQLDAQEMKETENQFPAVSSSLLHQRLYDFFHHFHITQLQPRSFGWTIPKRLLPAKGRWEGYAILKNDQIVRFIVTPHTNQLQAVKAVIESHGLRGEKGVLQWDNKDYLFTNNSQSKNVSPSISFTLLEGFPFTAKLEQSSIEKSHRIEDLIFFANLLIQEIPIEGRIPYHGLEIANVNASLSFSVDSPYWIHKEKNSSSSDFVLPTLDDKEGIILPKSFREAGVRLGDQGNLSYMAITTSVLQEQLIPIYVAGFYDPGIIPIGGKFLLANRNVVSLIRSSHPSDDRAATTNGINVRLADSSQASIIKEQLQKKFIEKGIDRYWKIETYREYEFTKAIMQELQSQKNLFMLIAIVIILVACSNIISMLIILVNDKKQEIGVLRSMGASSTSIAFIFGLAGSIIGILGSCMGIGTAILTLAYLNSFIYALSWIQGHPLFDSSFYGEVLPNELSAEALFFVLVATVCLSLLAGVIPAMKACLLRPSQILRADGA